MRCWTATFTPTMTMGTTACKRWGAGGGADAVTQVAAGSGWFETNGGRWGQGMKGKVDAVRVQQQQHLDTLVNETWYDVCVCEVRCRWDVWEVSCKAGRWIAARLGRVHKISGKIYCDADDPNCNVSAGQKMWRPPGWLGLWQQSWRAVGSAELAEPQAAPIIMAGVAPGTGITAKAALMAARRWYGPCRLGNNEPTHQATLLDRRKK